MKYLMVCVLFLSACAQTGGKNSKGNYQESDLAQANEDSPAMLNVRMGVSYFERNDLPTALEKLKRAIAYDPKLAIAHSAIALIYSNMRATIDAERHYKLSVKYAPNDPTILNNYGTFLCQRGEYKKAVSYYKKTIDNPFYKTPETAHENAGVCLMNDDDFAAAENHFRAALKTNPNLPVSLYNMVIIRAEKKDYMNARAFVQRLEGVANLDERILKIAYEVEKKMGNEKGANKYLTTLRKIKKT